MLITENKPSDRHYICDKCHAEVKAPETVFVDELLFLICCYKCYDLYMNEYEEFLHNFFGKKSKGTHEV
jgi:hypothetical protein